MQGRQLAWRRPGGRLRVGAARRSGGSRVGFGGDRRRRRTVKGPRRRLRAEGLPPACRSVRQDADLRAAFTFQNAKLWTEQALDLAQ